MALWVPPTISRELQAEAAQDEAEVRLAMALKGQLDWWNRELKKIDERLEMAWFPEGTSIVGVVPGRYHVLRFEPGAPVTIIPVTGPNGEFVEPNSAVFDKLRQSDLWNDQAQRARRRAQEELTRAKERQAAREREERREELQDRARAAWGVSVSMSKAGPWRQTAKARRP
jgi:hypothetical protein